MSGRDVGVWCPYLEKNLSPEDPSLCLHTVHGRGVLHKGEPACSGQFSSSTAVHFGATCAGDISS
eukprot:6476230-Amphidinium_carterae.1